MFDDLRTAVRYPAARPCRTTGIVDQRSRASSSRRRVWLRVERQRLLERAACLGRAAEAREGGAGEAVRRRSPGADRRAASKSS